MPTLLSLLGQSPPNYLQGADRTGVFEGTQTLEGNDVIIQHNGVGDRDLADECQTWSMPPDRLTDLNSMNTLPWRSVVTSDRWKLTLCAADQGELYALNEDPAETRNLFDLLEHHDRVRMMATRIRLWQEVAGDTAPLPAV